MNTNNATTTTTTKRKSPPRTTSSESSSTSVSSLQKKMRIMKDNQQNVMVTTTTTTIACPQDLNHHGDSGAPPLSAILLISPSSGSLSSDNSSSTSSRCASPDTITTSVLVVAVPSKEQPNHHHQQQHHHVITPQSSRLSSDLAEELEVPLLQDSKLASSFLQTTTNMTTSSMDAQSKPTAAISSWSIRWKIMTFIAVLFCYQIQETTTTTTTRPGQNSVCVDGGGFSGFWFTLGRLHSLAHPLNQDYYCYSAGCLGVVAALSNYSKDEMLDMALDKQRRWQAGTLNRHDIVGAFLDDLIHGTGTAEISDDNSSSNSNQTISRRSSSKLLERVQQDSRFLSSLHIITSQRRPEKGGFVLPFGMQTSIRTPTSVPELREMLLQTTWIPFAVGSSFFYKDHMDGAFTLAQHPACARRVGLALDFNLLMNAVNVNLPGIMAEQFWMAGLEYGL